MSNAEYDSVLCVKNEVFVYRIPPRTSNRGYRAADWKLDQPDWTGRLRVVARGKTLSIKLEDKNSGELFAECPVETYPSIAVEAVMDSSRYFVLMIKDDQGRSAFIGIGFQDRADSFDLNVSLQDHFKWLKQEAEAEKSAATLDSGPKLDLGFKEGQTITLNIGSKRDGAAKARPRAKAGGAIGLLPPPPGGVKLPPPGGVSVQAPPQAAQPVAQPVDQPASGTQNLDLVLDIGGAPALAPLQPAQPTKKATPDLWGDFTSADFGQSQNSNSSNEGGGGPWVQF
ncbi:adaptin ear-binding coat-associated protein 1-like [Haliotis rufescens]|uniref:adaptin ear-binding coat-associated protein 1-like n=1 Tax=Haliotis rufescens TaxID=6454 RepID=UPI001EB06130|nr:adaptin ear-binding coat-associated protein 1-like [Haliotis rufescens]